MVVAVRPVGMRNVHVWYVRVHVEIVRLDLFNAGRNEEQQKQLAYRQLRACRSPVTWQSKPACIAG